MDAQLDHLTRGQPRPLFCFSEQGTVSGGQSSCRNICRTSTNNVYSVDSPKDQQDRNAPLWPPGEPRVADRCSASCQPPKDDLTRDQKRTRGLMY
ncbi:unnamed protein product [Gadus morhua 'NCC']